MFLYTDNELSERYIKKTILFTVASQIIKYWGINLSKEFNSLYTENHAIDKMNWIRHKWSRKINIVKMVILLRHL